MEPKVVQMERDLRGSSMFLIRFDRGLYAYAFLGTVFCVLGLIIWDDPSNSTILKSTLVAGSFPFFMSMCEDEEYGYLAGLEHLARRHAGPIVNITAMLFTLLFCFVHMICIVMSILGLFFGRQLTVRWWSKLTERERDVKRAINSKAYSLVANPKNPASGA
jgi:hypothetical protein